ncbi:MAG: hypothetical protein ABI895_01185 [Deltaproteobacteria bacterium]
MLHVGYVLAVSCLFTAGECARYRYLIEPFIWLIVTRALVSAVARVRRGVATGLFSATGGAR